MTQTRTVGTKGVPREQREQLILDAATAEFGRYGYAGTSLSAVATGAGVSKPLILSYFGSKDQLFVACVQRGAAELVDRIEAVLAVAQPPLDMAADTLTAIFTGLEPRPHDWNVINDRTMPAGSAAEAAAKQIRATIIGQAARGVGAAADWKQLTDPDDVSALVDIWAGAVTALVNWWLRHPEYSATQMSERGRRIIAALGG